MDPVIYIVVLAVVALVAFVMGRAMASSGEAAAAPTSLAEPTAARPTVKASAAPQRDDLSEIRTQLSESEKGRERLESELRKVREDVKDARQKAHDRGQRLEQTRKELEDERRKVRNLGTIEAAREEMLAARAEVERLEAELKRMGRQLAERPVDVAAEPVKRDPAQEESDTIRRYESILVARDAEFRREFRQQNDELRASFNQQVAGERERYKTEIRELQGKLRAAMRDADRERRRSEANDRAYLLLKSQLEGTLDRLAVHDPSLRRPDALHRPDAVASSDPA